MKSAYFQKLIAYKLLEKFGDEEMARKVDNFLDRCEKCYTFGTKDNEWAFWVVEQEDDDDEHKMPTSDFKTAVLEYNGKEQSEHLEILVDFDFNTPAFRHALNNASFTIVKYYASKSRSLISDADIMFLKAIKTNGADASIVTEGGTMFGKTNEIVRVDNILTGKTEENENI